MDSSHFHPIYEPMKDEEKGLNMLLQRVLNASMMALSFGLMAGIAHAADANRPAAIGALEERGLTHMQEFDAGGEVRGFAGVAGDRSVAVYVLPDGSAIVGTRLNASGDPVDEATLQRLAAQPMSDQAWAQLEAAIWVLDGRADAPRIVYIFTDANCPYCHRFWEAARPWVYAGKVQLRHVLVGVIKEDSPGKAAAILGAADSAAALRENAVKFDQGGITPLGTVSDEVRGALEDNQLLMLSMGFRGTPGIMVRDDDGLVRKYNGMPQQNALTDVLGPR